SDSDFEDPDCRFCLRLIAQEYKSKDILDIDRILTELEFDEKDSDRLAALLSAKPQYTSSNIEVITEDLIRTIKTDQLESKKREITEKIKELEKTGSVQEIKRLMEELTEIIERIHLIS
ncbi:MAG: hypothetical protein RBT15_09485, partial [Gudongella sp.]|nr:hypothetical protein [Gudongella sp.]